MMPPRISGNILAKRVLVKLSLTVAVGALILAFPVVAIATDSGTDTTTADTTPGSGELANNYRPAVTVAEEPPVEIVQPWTNRYLIPTMAALAVVLLLVTLVQYFLKVVKARYKVVE